MIRALALVAGLLVTTAQTGPSGERTTLADNASVAIERFHLAAGAVERLAATDAAALVVQLTAGDVDLTIGDKRASGPREPGAIAFVPARTSQSARNIAPRAATDIVVIRFKMGRTPAPSMPSVDAPAGITRTPILDNADARVVRVHFSPDGREPVHTHPYDLITLQISPARVEILDGDAKSTENREPGFVKFVPRNRPHAFASADAKPFEILSVALK
ncbi:MAG TPA: hypothetical protein VGY57_12410 [Vicinamibacterales bacterium]|jgi:quercetin dioxygenase-like cupin family protein|nr:hypothetical protein [Vicinamibacterales bacterium]